MSDTKRDTRRTIDFGDLLDDLERAVAADRHKTLSEGVRTYVREALERRGQLARPAPGTTATTA